MIQEQYVSFETAKLLKEKKALIDYTMGYDKDGDLCNAMKCGVIDGKRVCVLNGKDNLLMAPTQSMVMRWLREVHHYYIQVMLDSWAWGGHTGYYVVIQKTDSDFEIMLQDFVDEVFYQTYEEACEGAIKYCLENLIEPKNE